MNNFPKVGKFSGGFSKGWKNRAAGTSFFLLAVAAACFWLSGRMNESLLELRKQYRLDQADPLENSPPLVAFTTVAIGGFRGILADILWIRASTMQEEGQYFELVQLSDWITKLEPRFADVWAFQAWNMAYNISVFFNTPEDRWRWVRHGIELLRDEGLRYNPGSAPLYRELGWMFQHKLGAAYDEMHMTYKQEWAREMTALFDGPRPDYSNLSAAVSQRLMQDYKLDPAVMERIDREYGPLDWRLPPAHALYWGLESRRFATDFDAMAADRMIFQAMADEFRQGALLYRPAEGVFVLTPNLAVLPHAKAAYEAAIAAHPEQKDTMELAYQNFLRSAIVTLFSAGRYDTAQQLYNEMNRRFPSDSPTADLDTFLYQSMAGNAASLSRDERVNWIEDLEFRSLFWQALGEDGLADGNQQLAELAWKKASADSKEALPPLKQLRESALQHVLANPPSTQTQRRLMGKP